MESSAAAHSHTGMDDIAARLASLVEHGGTVVQNVTDVGYGMLLASVSDPNGSTIGLLQAPNG